MRKRVYILGILVGITAPIFGLFIGLQVSSILGNILTSPLILLSLITGEPFGTMPKGLWLVGVLISVGLWIAIFALIDKLVRR